jgi:hypothetical protein
MRQVRGSPASATRHIWAPKWLVGTSESGCWAPISPKIDMLNAKHRDFSWEIFGVLVIITI